MFYITINTVCVVHVYIMINTEESSDCFTGHQSPLSLPRPVGRQPVQRGRAPDPDLPAVSHLRPLYPQRLHPRPRLLCTSSRLPGPLPPGGERA